MAGARGNWNSSFGFIMAAVGSAVGLGNLVRFPRELAGNGGAAFLIVYLLLLLLVGLPAMLGEMSLGKMTQASPVNAFRKLGGEHGKKWAVLGVAGLLAAMFVLFFYTVMTGWTLWYVIEGLNFGGAAWMEDPASFFNNKVETGPMTILFHGIVSAITIYIVSRGISGGIEKVTSIIIPALFVIIVGIVVYALFQPGMGAGYAEIFKPDFSNLSPANVSKATGQVFFSLSLGQGAMLTYASYMEKKQSVTKNGTIIAGADTGVAILAGMMIFPVLAFTGLLSTPEMQNTLAGGSFSTAFIALPSAFMGMGAGLGQFIGTVFFLGLFFAALSSAISLIEVPVSVIIDNWGWERWKAVLGVGLVTYTFGVVSSVNADWFVLYDEIAINIFIVIGVAFTTFFAGWIAPGVAKELDSGLRSRIGIYAVWMMRTVTPALILATFVFGGLVGTDLNGDLSFWQDPGACDAAGIEDKDCQSSAAGWNNLWHEIRHVLHLD